MEGRALPSESGRSGVGERGSVDSFRSDLERAVDRAAKRYVGLAVVAARHGEVTTLCRGRADKQRPPAADTLFQIGSITKTFTALLLADAVIAGEVALDQPAQELFPDVEVPARRRPFTLLDLATHTSGLPRLPPGLARQAIKHREDPYAELTTDQALRALERTRLRRPPGRRIRYSNFGAGLLGVALERATGRPYQELVEGRICRPLGLVDTTVDPVSERADRRAQGHSRRGRPVPDWQLPALPGMGALWSTPADLNRFLQAMLSPPPDRLGEAVAMTQVVRVGARGPLSMCLGWHRLPLGRTGQHMLFHNGGTGGFFSWLGFVPATGAGALVLTNTSRPVDRLGVDVIRML